MLEVAKNCRRESRGQQAVADSVKLEQKTHLFLCGGGPVALCAGLDVDVVVANHQREPAVQERGEEGGEHGGRKAESEEREGRGLKEGEQWVVGRKEGERLKILFL